MTDNIIHHMPLEWDNTDTLYLANTFNTEQLRYEIASVKRKFPYEDWHSEYIKCCQDAIKLIKQSQPKPVIKNSKFVDIASLKSTLDIVDIAERYTHLNKSGRNFKALCPFHSEKQPSFMVYPDRQTWHCFGACNTGGDVFNLVMKAENTDFKGALAILGGNQR